MAFEQGLGTCCQGSADWPKVEKAFGLPESCRIVVGADRGLSAGEAERRRDSARACPFEELFRLNAYDNPFPRSAGGGRRADAQRSCFQEPAPKSGREEEIESDPAKYDSARLRDDLVPRELR